MLARVVCVADENDFPEITQFFARNGLELGEQTFTEDGYLRAAVIKDVFVFVRFSLGVDRNGYRADFYGSEKGVEKFGRVEKQEEHSVFRTDAKIAKRVAGAVGAFKKLLIGDLLVATFDGDVFGSPFENIAIDEIGGHIEKLRQRDHVAAIFVAR